MTPDDDDTGPPVSTATVYRFIDELRRVDGFRIGPREETAVARLLSELFARGLIKSERDLKPHLQPLLARTADERERFALAFDRRFPPPLKPAPTPPAPTAPEKPAPLRERVWRWAAALVLLLFAGLVARALMVSPDAEQKPPTTVDIAGTPDKPVGEAGALASVRESSSAPTTADEQAADDAVTLVLNAAAHWSYAPTLDELSETLGPMIGWRPEGLAIRMRELTALPRTQPLPLLGFDSAPAPRATADRPSMPDAGLLMLVAFNATHLADPRVRLDGAAVERAARAAIDRTRNTGVPVYRFAMRLMASDAQWIRFFAAEASREPHIVSIADKLLAAKRKAQFSNPDRDRQISLSNLEKSIEALAPTPSAPGRYRAISLAMQKARAEAAESDQRASTDMLLTLSDFAEFARSKVPEPGAVLLINDNLSLNNEKSGARTRGFFAVVQQVNTGREIVVDLANWQGKGEINLDALVTDVSEANNWSQVTVGVNPGDRHTDRVYIGLGFILSPSEEGRGAAPWQPRPHYAAFSIAPRWTPWAAVAVIFALTLLWLAASSERRKAYLRRRRPESFFSIHELVADQIKDTGSRKLLLNRAAQRLQRWSERETDRLDVERTVAATLLAGKFTTVHARAKAQPDYLVLIEASGTNDVQAALLRALARCLEERTLNVKVFYFSATPAWCHAEASAGYRAPFANHPVPIEELVSRFGDHRLIVLGSGERFVAGADARWVPSVLQLARWPARAMLTPVGLSEWSAHEFALARELELPLGRATEEGLLALAALLKLDEMEAPLYSARGDGRAQSLPQVFRLDRVEWTLDQGPHDVAWEDLRAMLVRYLDPDAYFWLCACAVYPAVRWDLTLFLGLTLEGGDGAKLYREDRLSALAALPWFREGRMPDWLRRRLIAEIGNEAPAIRDVLRGLVERSRVASRKENETVTLRIATRDDAGVEEAFDDEIFLDFLAKGDVTDLQISWLDALKALLPNRALQWLDPVGVAVVASGLLMAAAAFVLAPRGGRAGLLDGTTFASAALPHGAWAPLFVVLMAALVGLVFVDSGPLRRLARASGATMHFLLVLSLLALLQSAVDVAIYAKVKPTKDMLAGPVPLFALGLAMIALIAAREVRRWLRRSVVIPTHWAWATIDFAGKAAGLAALALGSLTLFAPSLLALVALTPEFVLFAALALVASACALIVERRYEHI